MDILKLCLGHGAMKAEGIAVTDLVLQPQLRFNCEVNHCGMYDRNYTCPPAVGDIDVLIAKLRRYKRAVILQNVYQLEDSFDIEGMLAGQEKHGAMVAAIARDVYAALGRDSALVLSAGSCTLCAECAIRTRKPCPFPDDAITPLEAYGVNVSKISQVSSLRYINGANTVTYFAGVFTY